MTLTERFLLRRAARKERRAIVVLVAWGILVASVGGFFNSSSRAAERRDALGVYKPREFGDMDFNDPLSKWSFARSRRSEHFIVFWERAFGDDPNSESLPESTRVDVDDLLEKAERFYVTNAEKLGFRGDGKSCLDLYKTEIYLFYREDWLATGSGYDDAIGALWISPATCRPVGAAVAHETGHAFQYLVYCDNLLNGESDRLSGFRYAHKKTRRADACGSEAIDPAFRPADEGMGNTIWEQSAEWQAFQDYPREAFAWNNRDAWLANCHRAFENEWMRYQSYWLFYALQETRGAGAIGETWRASREPEDFLECCVRLYFGGDVERFNDWLWFYASRCATFDFDGLRDLAPRDWEDGYRAELYPTDRRGVMRIGYASCPGIAGFNAIPLDPARFRDGTATIRFRALEPGSELAADDPGDVHVGDAPDRVAFQTRRYNAPEEPISPEHRFGFVARLEDGSRVYGELRRGAEEEVVFKIPEQTRRLWFVVVGAASEYRRHVWNENESDDLQLPYEITIVE